MISQLYQLVIFLHVLGAVGIFAALGIESVCVGRLESAAVVVDARVWMEALKVPSRLGMVAMTTTVGAGIWMMAQGWGRQPWIVSAVVGLVGMVSVGAAVSLRGARRLRAALSAELGPELSPAFRRIQSTTGLLPSLRLRIGIGIGILGLMTVRPDALGSWTVLAASALAGLLAGVASVRPRAAPPESATGPGPVSSQ